MDISHLKKEAHRALTEVSYPPRKVVAIHTGITLGVSLVLTLVSAILNSMGSTGGLNSLGTQAALSTAQTALQLASALVMPFWTAGLIFWAIGCARQRNIGPRSLAEGFRRWKPILTSMLMMGLWYLGVGFFCAYLASALLMMTPAGAPMINAAQTMMKEPTADLYTLLGDDLPMTMAWYFGFYLLAFGALAVPRFYRWRLVHYVIMDDQKVGGLQAMFLSRAMTQDRRMKLFRLDLSFWWFYLLELLATVLALGDVLLSLLGVTQPVPGWCFSLVSMACQFGLYVWAKPRLMTTYAFAYEKFRQPRSPKPQPPMTPKAHPWNY